MNQQLILCSDFLRSHFQTDEELSNSKNLDDLKNRLLQFVKYLLDNDFERLVQACYKVDIEETILKSILSSDPPQEVAINLTHEIIKREMQKVETRLRYKNQ